LFHNDNFGAASKALDDLLNESDSFNDEILKIIIDKYLADSKNQ